MDYACDEEDEEAKMKRGTSTCRYLLDSGLQEPWRLTDGDELEEALQLREFLQNQLEVDSSMLVLMIYERNKL